MWKVFGDRRVCLIISDTADLLQFSQSTVSRVYGEWSEKEKIEWSEKEWQLCGQKWVSLMPEVRGE